jgi:Uma2 family endonuclease
MVGVRPATKLTYEDYRKTPDDERWELLNGELTMPPSPGTAHQRVSQRLGRRLGVFVEERSLGEVFAAPTDVVLSDANVVQPDLLFVSTEQEHIITPENIRGAPDLVVEILSPSTASRDWREKHDLYAEHGVREYWVVDPDAQRAWVMVQRDGVFDEVGVYGRGDVLTSPTVKDFTVNLDEIFQPQTLPGEAKTKV